MTEKSEVALAYAVDSRGGTPRPLLLYDGDCAFCEYWACHWQKLTGDKVDYSPFQQVAERYPEIPRAEFQRAVQYLAPDGRRSSAAEASFLTLSHAAGRSMWLTLYRTLPGFAAVSEWAYAFVAAHRAAAFRVTLCLWGREFRPPRYDLVSFLFLRAFGVIYLSAFISFAVQARGLIGSHGILPLADLVGAISRSEGSARFFLMPMLFWWNSSDAAIQFVCWSGAFFASLLACNVLPRMSLVMLHVLYLSLLYGGQTFMAFQWDVYLLETGFLALVLTFARAPGIWLLRWLLFRFMFMSGVVKLISGDPSWRSLSALSYHFLTQPLPTPIAWYAAQLPAGLLRLATGCMLAIELILPFLIFGPRRLRFAAAFGFLLLQTCIFVTGNYNWFNLQTMLLCLILFDDAAVRKMLPQNLGWLRTMRPAPIRPGRAPKLIVGAVTALVLFSSILQMDLRFGGNPPATATEFEGLFEPLQLVGAYGLFAVMTTERDEIVIQGSNDGVEWRDYQFRYKPGDPMRRPLWNIPHQPRLDWQMWFAALDDPRRLPWFSGFLRRVLENEPSVIALLAENPFPNKPPLYVRAIFYDYTYADAGEKAKGSWWRRRLLGLYYPPVRLKDGSG